MVNKIRGHGNLCSVTSCALSVINDCPIRGKAYIGLKPNIPAVCFKVEIPTDAIRDAYFTPSTVNNTIEQSVSFVSCVANDEEIVLISADKQIYAIRFIDEQLNASDIEAVCDGETVVKAYSTEVTPEDAEAYFSVKAIAHNGTYLLSFEETNRLHRQEYTILVVFMSGLCLVWGAIVVCSIIVGRNPRKFSKWFVRLFFKDKYIKY